MKRFALSLVLALTGIMASFGMNFRDAQQQAYFLSDKMAYELNLTPYQYDQVYQVNLEYFLNMNTYADIDGYNWRYRDADLSCILYDWQYVLYRNAEYFFRPLRWVNNAWSFVIWNHYRNDYYFYSRPAAWDNHRGGIWKGRSHHSPSPFYGHRHDTYKGGMNHNYGHPSNAGKPGHNHGYNGANHNYDRNKGNNNRNDRNNGGYNNNNNNNNRGNGGYNNNSSQGNRGNGGYNNNNNRGNGGYNNNNSQGNRGNGAAKSSSRGGASRSSSVSGNSSTRGGNSSTRSTSSTTSNGRSFGGGSR